MSGEPIVILLADDDEDDQLLTADALRISKAPSVLRIVNDGEELLEYLRHRGRYAAPGSAPRPGLILLDLNMPRMDGREALREIKSDEGLRSIPVVVLTTSESDGDVNRAYELGVNSFIVKPVTFEGLVETIQTATEYWFHVVQLPSGVVGY